jgi:FAD:protein FMN transferase
MRSLVLDWHQRLSVFEPGSIVSRINRTPVGVGLDLDEEMFSLLDLCDQLRIKTGGAFNIGAGTLMSAHGFRAQHIDGKKIEGLDLEHAFVLDDQRRTLTRCDERVSLDLGAIAKGFVLDLIHEELIEHGIADAFVHGGTSSILALGYDLGGQVWSVELGDGQLVGLSGMAMGVSRADGRMNESLEFGHIMDPRTNQPSASGVIESVCVHRSAAFADALSTACSVRPELVDRVADTESSLLVIDSLSRVHRCDPLGVFSSFAKETI